MSTPVAGLIEEIIKKQELAGSEKKLAQRLGVSRATLHLVKKGARQPGMKLLQALMREFPGMTWKVMDYLHGNGAGKKETG